MRVLALSGCKTERAIDLATAAIPVLRARGLTVSVLLQGPPDFDLDRPGKDSHRHRAAGALEVAISSTRRWALLHERGGEAPPAAQELIGHMGAADLLLVLGFAADGLPQLTLRPDLDGAGLARLILDELAAELPALAQ